MASTTETDPTQVVSDWIKDLQLSNIKADDPNYYTGNPSMLQTKSSQHTFSIGSGDDIYSGVVPSLLEAEREIILVTCFWAPSSTLSKLSDALKKISQIRIEQNKPNLLVFICLSSLSISQKLFQTSSLSGKRQSNQSLGLPPPEELRGLDLHIKSIFVKPFSVMHPKFIIVDRSKVWLPSCNVSWETWFEGCITLSGPIVQYFVTFWQKFWMPDRPPIDVLDFANRRKNEVSASSSTATFRHMLEAAAAPDSSNIHSAIELNITNTFTLFLPSPHHLNPRFRPFPTQPVPPPYSTPLNSFLLYAVRTASRTLYIQTPNLTSAPFIASLTSALERGVNIHIVTSEKLMRLEQLVTAGTTTNRCVRSLISLYKILLKSSCAGPPDGETGADRCTVGGLKIEYYSPIEAGKKEPVQSHLKLTVVDGWITILGSGNMDRASWYTSQELGVAFFDRVLAEKIVRTVETGLDGRVKKVYRSGGD
ncbi:hypothetical protein M501DRAFT_931708 [Patellaria atrata CBS 101060]|uniref:PLD phosphodiesterase domain-containing protein n=1 Tax=Patellaria atrata CBS 101060 TaxID=1346257 RepID=A0A9P4VTX2_9PEZI|nr:hypothetical protein M501DRAFT_931708 [Patellaria atrata CBS 101060]